MQIRLLKTTIRLILLSVLFTVSLNAQYNVQNYKILGIRVEGNKSADANTIIANSGLRVGDEIQIPGDETNNAIKRLWALGLFSPDISIEIEKKIENGVFLVIKLEEYSRLETLVIEGNDELSEEDVEAEIPFARGHILKTYDIYRSIIKLKQLYDEEGYLNAEIDVIRYEFANADTSDDEITVTWRNEKDFSDEYETVYDYDPESRRNILRKIQDRILLIYNIDEGDEVKVATINFVGNEAFDDDDLNGTLDETGVSAWWEFWKSNSLNKEAFEEDKALLESFYRSEGYRDFEILGDSIIFNRDKNEVEILVSVYEGPQYKIRKIDWEGNSLFPDAALSEQLGFYKGDIYDYELLQQNLFFNEKQNDISSLFQNYGYLMLNIELEENRVESDSIDLVVNITENNRFKIGDVNIAGNDKTKEKVIRRELFTIPGDYYSRDGIMRSIQQLANLQYFNVEKLYQNVQPQPVNDSTVAVNYTLEEKSSDYLNASVGYSGGFGFSGSIGVTLTNFSITEPFQMGGGQILNFNWQFGVGNYYRTFSLGFTEPWFMDTPTMVGFNVFDTRQRYIYDLRQTGITLSTGRRLTWPDNYFYLQGSLKYQYNDIIDGRSYYAEGKYRQFMLGLVLSRTDIDNPIFPSKGSKISLAVDISGGPVLPGEVDYYKLNLKTELYKRLFNSNRVAFYFGAEMGYLEELSKSTVIGPFEYFFMGGNGMVIATTPLRGYEDRTIGPRNAAGREIGGRVMTKYTAEIRGALAMEPIPIYILGFAEAGNVFYNMASTDLFDLKRSAGIGARLLINPIGLIGFDFGYGFDRPTVDGNDPKWMFHFQFGKGF